MNITETALKRPVATIILTLSLLFFGLYSYNNMGVEQTPNVDLPVVIVQTTMDGATAQVMDNDVTDVLEEEINTVTGIDTLQSFSYMGKAITVVQFDVDRDIDAAAADVRDKVSQAKGDLPDEADDPIIAKYDISDAPVVMITVKGPASYAEKVYFVDKVLKVKLQSISGVGNVDLPGLRDREIRVWIDPVRLRSRGLMVEDLKNAINSKHVELPAGSINMDRYKFDLRVDGEYESVEQLKSLPITTRDGVTIRLGEVADVEDGFEELENTSVENGQETIMLAVKKQRGANEVALCDRIVERFDEFKALAPEGIELDIPYRKSDFIRQSMSGVATDVVQAVILCSLLMLFFMQTFRATFITCISMPVCLIGSFMVLSYLGITINNMSMMGISLAVGMVVDATTVVLENIHTKLEGGMLPYDAALTGAKEVSFAVIGGALTTIGVFAPIATMGGLIGRFFYAFGMTVVVTISLSLIIAITLTPFSCSRILRVTSPGKVAKACNAFLQSLENGYRRVLAKAVHHKTITLAIALALFLFGCFVQTKVGSTFYTNDDTGMFIINCEMETGIEIEETTRVMENIASIVRAHPAVLRSIVVAGTSRGSVSNKGSIYVQLIPHSQREGVSTVITQIRNSVQGFKDVKMDFTMERGKDVQMVIAGADTETLCKIADEIIADMEATGKMIDAEPNVRLDKPQLNVRIDRNMTDAMDVDVRTLSTEIQAYFSGVKAGVFKEGGYRYDIRLMARRDNRSSVSDLELLSFKNGSGEIVQAPGLITVEQVMAPSVINRYSRQTAVVIEANVTKDYSTGEAVQFITESAKRHIPEGSSISIMPSGYTKNMQTEFARLFRALMIGIAVVYIVMAIQFESFLHPFTVMFSLPLMTPGVFFMMYLLHVRLDVMAYMGIILLVGLVVNNGIILVDVINRNRLAGMNKVDAVIAAGPSRLRAILITSLSTLIGAIPAALKLSVGSESRQPMSTALFGGLFTSTLLTLLVIPCVYIVLDNMKEFLGKKLFQRKLP